MSRKRDRPNRPIERLRNTWESTADLEETIVAMFDVHVEPHSPALPRFIENPGAAAPVLGAPELSAPELSAPALGAPEYPEVVEANGNKQPAQNGGRNSGAPALEAPALEAPALLAPVYSAPDLDAPGLSAPGLGGLAVAGQRHADPRAANTEAPELSAPELSAPGFPAPGLDLSRFVYSEAPKPRPWKSAQDAHTHAEQNLYQAMYSRGKPLGLNARGLVIGVRSLAKLVPMAYSNCHANLKSLMDKLAIEERPAERYTDGRLFVIYNYEEILRRRRSAGLTHVLKRTRGVALVNPGALNTGAPGFNPGDPNPGDPEFNESAPALGNTGAPELGPHIKNKEVDVETSSTIMAEISSILGFIDDDAIARLLATCRRNAPDVTNEELAYFAKGTAERISRMRGITNPIGLLITQLPKCFEGVAFRQFREAEQRKRAAELEQGRQQRLEWQRVLEDPATSEEDRAWLRQALEDS